MQLMKRSEKLTNFWTRRSTCLPADAFVNSGTSRVFVASTAYNFLNVFRPHRFQRGKRPPLSTNPLTVLEFDSEDKAWIAFGILSSRLTYWWWHVHCDGFHVPAWFVESIPLSDATFTPAQCTQLISGAKQLWQSLQSHIIVSLNGGSQTIAYRPLACEVERDTIDKLVLRGAGVPPEFADVLRRFVRSNAVVDEKDNSRDAIQLHFQKASVNA
jgi:hypothetical protein